MADVANGPSISVVTVTFNSEGFIRACCTSVAQNAGPVSVEHVVLDNGSTDATVDIIRKELPGVHLVENRKNLGFTAANNQGASMSRGRYIVFLNPDTIVPEGVFATMADRMDRDATIGVLAPRLVDQHGGLSDMGHRAPTAWTLINGFLLLNRISPHRFPGVVRNHDIHGTEDCEWACGACLMVRREIVERFQWRAFGSGDDFDYCTQIREAGWRIVLTGDVEVIHFSGRSWVEAKPTVFAGTPSNFALHLRAHHGALHTAVGIAGMRLGLHLRGAVHRLLYRFTKDPERLYKANRTRQFLAHDDYSVFRKAQVDTPVLYPGERA
jgi:GT2 family glycosyltransferase